MRWLIVMPYARPGAMGIDFAEELRSLGHVVETFAYRRDNVLYKNKPTKTAYQRALNRRLERLCADQRPDVVLVVKGGPIAPDVVRRMKTATSALVVNFFPDNPLWMMPFEQIEPYDLFFTKERYALRQLELVGLRNLHYLPMYCVPSLHHPVALEEEVVRRLKRAARGADRFRALPWATPWNPPPDCIDVPLQDRHPCRDRSSKSGEVVGTR